MRARSKHEVENSKDIELILTMEETPIKLKGNYIGYRVFNDKKGQSCSINLTPILSLIMATTNYDPQKDIYAVVIMEDGAMEAVNVGRFRHPDYFVFDMNHYKKLDDKIDKIKYLVCTSKVPAIDGPFHMMIKDVTTDEEYGEFFAQNKIWQID